MALISYEVFVINVGLRSFSPMNALQYPLKTILRNARASQIVLAL